VKSLIVGLSLAAVSSMCVCRRAPVAPLSSRRRHASSLQSCRRNRSPAAQYRKKLTAWFEYIRSSVAARARRTRHAVTVAARVKGQGLRVKGQVSRGSRDTSRHCSGTGQGSRVTWVKGYKL